MTLRIGCPNICDYCPQGVLRQVYQGQREFTLPSFQDCLENGKVPLSKNLTFMGFGEPFLCRDCVSIIRWSMLTRGHGGSISTTLRGATREGIDALAGLPFTDTIIHVPDDNGRMKLEVTDEWLDLFAYALTRWRHHEEFNISCYGPPHRRLLPLWTASGLRINNYRPHDRAGLLPNEVHAKHRGPLFTCGKRYCGHLLPNGDVCRCCSDYGLQNVWGNLHVNTYDELYHSQAFRDYMKSLNVDGNTPCHYCTDTYHQTNPEDQHKTYENPCD